MEVKIVIFFLSDVAKEKIIWMAKLQWQKADQGDIDY